MALVRVLVDGYNLIHALCNQAELEGRQKGGLLHEWRELPTGARHSERARDALADLLQQYQDAKGTPVTVFFDGRGGRGKPPAKTPADAVEVLYSAAGQTADDLIERAAHRFQDYGEVLVVTDDFAERDTVSAFNASVASCANFTRMIDEALAELQDSLKRHNHGARSSFRKPGI
jgi:predicted RNA-binding protein with PIN domain